MSEVIIARSRVGPSPNPPNADKPLEEFFLTHDPLTGWPIPDPRDEEDAPL